MNETNVSSDHWLAERIRETPLPQEVATEMGRALGTESVETLDEFVSIARDATGGGALAVDDLCHVSETTPHRATTKQKTYHFRCFFDAVVLAHLVDERVEIRTESPAGKQIEARATPDGGIDTTPPNAVMSFGVAVDTTADDSANGSETDWERNNKGGCDSGCSGDDGPTRVEATMCPYVNAFATREAYERWDRKTNAATVGLSLAAGVSIATALAD
ncbi:organomercurial lyase [Halocatena marina]|uniref:organomercurial lyase n=1 Tax=Halocatena marina TaxID=2934937 RepID=UPI0036F35CFD